MYISLIENLFFPCLSLILATLIGGEIIRRMYSPKVKVKIKGSNYLKNKDGFLIAVEVVNMGSTIASRCISYLIIDDDTSINIDDLLKESDACTEEYLPTYDLENIDLGYPRRQWITPDKFVQPKRLVLCWNHSGDPYELDINPGVTVSLNICRVRYKSEIQLWYLIFPTETGWRKIRLRMKYKRLSGKLFICPSNAYPLVIKFCLIQNDKTGEPYLCINNKPLNSIQRRRILNQS